GDCAGAGGVRVDDDGAVGVVAAPALADRVHRAGGGADVLRPGGVPGVDVPGLLHSVAAAASVPFQPEGGLAVHHRVGQGAGRSAGAEAVVVPAAVEVFAQVLGDGDEVQAVVEVGRGAVAVVGETAVCAVLLEVLLGEAVEGTGEIGPPGLCRRAGRIVRDG